MRGRRALVIDDSAETREMYSVVLRLEGLNVEEARNGEEGVARAIASRPDIIITDLSMPSMDGWETVRRLRADERTGHIPIIICSGFDDGQGVDSAADARLMKHGPLAV